MKNKMSIQRAKVNCERCYGLAKSVAIFKDGRLKCDLLYSVRNEAMRALEDAMDRIDNVDEEKCTPAVLETLPGLRANFSNALDACRDCDYSSSKIIYILEGSKK